MYKHLLKDKPINLVVNPEPILAPASKYKDCELKRLLSEYKIRYKKKRFLVRKLKPQEVVTIEAAFLSKFYRISTDNFNVSVWFNPKLQTFSAIIENKNYYKNIYWPDLLFKYKLKSEELINFRLLIRAARAPWNADFYLYWCN